MSMCETCGIMLNTGEMLVHVLTHANDPSLSSSPQHSPADEDGHIQEEPNEENLGDTVVLDQVRL